VQNQAEVVNIIGNVEGKDVLLVDDLVDTGGTLVSAIEALKKNGAVNIFASVTHPLLSGPALQRLKDSALTKLYVTDTIPLKNNGLDDKICVVTASEIFAEAIDRAHHNKSISSLFDVDKG
jgi:ribose-phosphate pyrophosphokinase